MVDHYEHFITKNIKAFYKKRLFSPILYLLILLLLWLIFPLKEMISPIALESNAVLQDSYSLSGTFVRGEFTDLTFSGYTKENAMGTSGYYYYGIRNGQCFLLLLSPSACEEGLPYIEEVTVTARIIKGKYSYRQVLANLAEDLGWTTDGITDQLPAYYYSEADVHMTGTTIFFLFYFGSLIYALVCLILYLLYIRFPVLSPPCLDLAIFGHPWDILEEAEEELATLPQLATEDMFITEHYFILTSPYGNAIVPIHEILWIYKYSTLHKFLWYHFSISYTLHITANKHYFIRCPKNLKSDIDGIMDYLSEANHDILVGFNEENRIKVQSKLGKPFHIEKLVALLRKRF